MEGKYLTKAEFLKELTLIFEFSDDCNTAYDKGKLFDAFMCNYQGDKIIDPQAKWKNPWQSAIDKVER